MQSRRNRRWVLTASAAILAAGIAVFLVRVVGDTGSPIAETFHDEPAQIGDARKTVKLDRSVRVVAGEFIKTAVQRKDLAAAWNLVGHELRGDLTLTEWLKGEIPVVPFLPALDSVRFKVDASYADDALLEVILLPRSDAARGQVFIIELKRRQGKWVVVSWVPRGYFAVPSRAGD